LDRYPNAEVVAQSEMPLDGSGAQVQRVRILRTEFKYPLVRIEETVTRTAGAEKVTDSKEMVADHLMVKRSPEVTEEAFIAAITDEGGTIRKKIRGADGVYLVAFPGEDTEALPAALQKFSTVSAAYAEPDYIVRSLRTPNDASYRQLWGMHNEGLFPQRFGTVSAGGLEWVGFTLRYSGVAPEPGVTGTVYDCKLGYEGDFPEGVRGNIALILRGEISFEQKARNAMAAGAKAVIFYNNVAQELEVATLGTPDPSWPPAFILSGRNGNALKALGQVTATMVISGSLPDADIDAPEAWEINTGSRDILVAVLDTGVFYPHPDLAANMWTNPGESGLDADGLDKSTNGLDDDGNGYIDDLRGWDFVNNDNDPMDDNFHGTHCAGTIGAVGNNGLGVAGVCWEVSLVGLKFLGANGGGALSDAVEAVFYSNTLGGDAQKKITSNSWGGGPYTQTLADAIAAANEKEILFIAAAGNADSNNDITPTYPTNYDFPNVISVAATDPNDELAGFSNFGATTVDLAAPGVQTFSTFPGGAYAPISGTSMATPHVAGTAALLWSFSPELTPAEIKSAILGSVDPLPALADKCTTGGRLNAFKALSAVGMAVKSSTPVPGSVLFSQPVEFVVNFSFSYAPASVDASDFTVNGIPADSFVLTDSDTVTFRFNSTPVGPQGQYTMAMAFGAVNRLLDDLELNAWSETFRYDADALTVTSTLPADGATVSLPFTTLTLNFNEAIDPDSVDAADFRLSQGAVTGVTVVDSDTVELALVNIVKEGTLTFTIPAGRITDTFGNPNVAYSGTYEPDLATVELPAEIAAVEPRGSMVFGATQAGSITTATDTDGFGIPLDAGQILTVLADPSAGLRPTVELRDASNNVVATATAAGAGQDAVIQAHPISTPGVFTIVVRGAGGSKGTYTLRPVINAVLEAENHDGPANDSRAASQSLNAAFILPGGPVATATVLGETPEDWFSFTLGAGDKLSATLKTSGDSALEIYDGTGALLARSVAGRFNVTEFIEKYVAGSAGTYHARVMGTTGSYALVLTKNAASDLEQNDSHAAAQEITGYPAASGAIVPGVGLFAVESWNDWDDTTRARIHTLDPVTGAIIRSFDAPQHPEVTVPYGVNLAHDGTNLWYLHMWDAADPTEQITLKKTIHKLNALTGEKLGSIIHTPAPDFDITEAPYGLAYVRGELFVADGTKIDVYSIATGQWVRSIDSPIEFRASNFVGLAGDNANNHLYGISQRDNKIYRIDPSDGALLASSPENFPLGLVQGMAVVADEIFISAIDALLTNSMTIDVYDRLTFEFKRRMRIAIPRFIAGLGGDGAGTTDDWFSFRVNEGDTLALATTTPFGEPQSPYFINNPLDPQIELYSPENTLLASNDNGAADGKNSVLSHTATATGLYRARVRGLNRTTGEYVLTVTGATGTAPVPQLEAATPANGDFLKVTPTEITINFGAPILLSSLQASDLTVDGVAATSFRIVDGDTVIFTLPTVGEGVRNVAIAAGAILAADGTAFAGFTSQFTVDLRAPRVISTTVQENDSVPTGNLTIAIQFSERLKSENIDATDFLLSGPLTGRPEASSFSYNANTSTLTIQYTGLVTEDLLTFTLRSGDGRFEDPAGNDLDGESVFPMPPNESGDGVAGGDFVVNFFVDQAGVGALPAFTASEPRGSLAYTSSKSAMIALPGDADSYTFTLAAGQTLAAAVRPNSTLRPAITVTGPGGSMGNATATAAGQGALVQAVTAATAGNYTITVTGAASTTGSYTVEAVLNALAEVESRSGADNNTTAKAQNIAASALSPAPGASRLAVDGRGDGISTEVITPDSFGYHAAMIGHRFEDISKTGNRLVIERDDFGYAIGNSISATDLAGFTFPLYGTNHSSLYINAEEGLITFGAPYNSFFWGNVGDKDLSIYPVTPSIAVLWNPCQVDHWTGPNLDPNTGVYWQVLGSGADRRLVIQWHKVAHWPSQYVPNPTPITFQAVLYASGDIEFNYPDLDIAPTSVYQEGILAGVGIKDAGTQSLKPASKRLLVKMGRGNSSPPIDKLRSAYVGSGKSVRISTGIVASPGADHFALPLTAGEKATLVINGGTSTVLELLNSAGAVVATGTSGATNLARAILDYTVPSTGTYQARVRATLESRYTLTALRAGGGIDLEANDTTGTAQELKPVIFGDTTGGADHYKVLLAPGDTIALQTYTPAVGGGATTNNLDPRIDVYDSTGALVAGNDNGATDGRNALVSYTAAAPGLHYIRVSGASGAGEYLLTASYAVRTLPGITISSPGNANVSVPANVGLILEGAVTSNSTPPGTVTATWSKVSGPGTVTFGDAAAANTTAKFSANGTYVLRLTADEAGVPNTRDLTVNVGATSLVWTGQDIGAVAAAGSYSESGGAFTVKGSGAEITGTKDEFQYVHVPLTGDGEMIVRVASLVTPTPSAQAKAGVMIRETTETGSRHASLLISSRNTDIPALLRSRAVTNGTGASVTISNMTRPIWLKIVRTGNTLAGYTSPDGVTWTQAGSNLSITMNASVRIGLAVTSANDGTLCTAVFDNISTTAGIFNVGASVNAGADATINSEASTALDATVTDDGRPAPLAVAWSKVSGPGTVTFGSDTAIDTTATFSEPGDYVLRLTANDGWVKTFDEVSVIVRSTATPGDAWREALFGTTENSGVAADSADPDGDGMVNLLERALGSDPNSRSSADLPVSSREIVDGDEFLALTIQKSPDATDVTFIVEVSADLATWNSGSGHTTIIENTSTMLKVRDNTPMRSAAKRFIRLRVTSP
jgi:subtilisin family serine protease/methionine-rich copper-binding protein CopC